MTTEDCLKLAERAFGTALITYITTCFIRRAHKALLIWLKNRRKK